MRGAQARLWLNAKQSAINACQDCRIVGGEHDRAGDGLWLGHPPAHRQSAAGRPTGRLLLRQHSGRGPRAREPRHGLGPGLRSGPRGPRAAAPQGWEHGCGSAGLLLRRRLPGGPGHQKAGAFSLQAEHDLSHAVYLLLSGSTLGRLRRERRCARLRGTGPGGTRGG
jgi:hypothetical protein